MGDDLQQIHPVLVTIPGLENLAPGAFTAERLGGLTNLVYRVDVGEDRYVLRIPGKGTEEYIDRKVEIHNARIAAKAGVSAEVIYADTSSGMMLPPPGTLPVQVSTKIWHLSIPS